MQRVDDPTASGSLPTPAAPGTPGYFIAGTFVTQDWVNMVQEELARFIENTGITLSKSNFGQLQKAIGGQSVMNFLFEYDPTLTDAKPGAGLIRLNHATPASVTEIYVDDADENAVTASATLQAMVAGEKIIIQDRANYGNQFIYEVSSVSNETGYTKFIVTLDVIIGAIATGAKLSVVAQRGTNANTSGRLLQVDHVQGSVKAETDTTPGYVDSTDIYDDASSAIGATEAIYSSRLNSSAGGVSSTGVWSDVLPLTMPTGTNKTIVKVFGMLTSAAIGDEEDNISGEVEIDWLNSRVRGLIAENQGSGYAAQQNYWFAGAIGAATTTDFTGTAINGTGGAAGSAPLLRVNNTSGNQIDRLPMPSVYRNVTFTIKHYS